MPQELIEATVVEAQEPPPAGREAGKFAPGNTFSRGRVRNAKNRLQSGMLQEFEDYLTENPTANPLLVLARISIGEVYDDEGKKIPVPTSVRANAAGKLGALILPRDLATLRIGEVNFDQRRLATEKVLNANPGFRGAMERMARQIAAAQVTDADSHIIPAYLSPGLREAIEADTVPEIIPGRAQVREHDCDH